MSEFTKPVISITLSSSMWATATRKRHAHLSVVVHRLSVFCSKRDPHSRTITVVQHSPLREARLAEQDPVDVPNRHRHLRQEACEYLSAQHGLSQQTHRFFLFCHSFPGPRPLFISATYDLGELASVQTFLKKVIQN